MSTKADLQSSLDEIQEMLDAAADVLTDPSLSDREARIEAVRELGFRPPTFLAAEEEAADDDDEAEDDEDDEEYEEEDWEDED